MHYVSKFVLYFTKYGDGKLESFLTTKVTFKLIGNCHSIGHIRFPIATILCIAPLTRYHHLFPKFKEVM